MHLGLQAATLVRAERSLNAPNGERKNISEDVPFAPAGWAAGVIYVAPGTDAPVPGLRTVRAAFCRIDGVKQAAADQWDQFIGQVDAWLEVTAGMRLSAIRHFEICTPFLVECGHVTRQLLVASVGQESRPTFSYLDSLLGWHPAASSLHLLRRESGPTLMLCNTGARSVFAALVW